MDMSEFVDASITRGRDAKVMFWNISVLVKTSSTCKLVMGFGVTLMLGFVGL